MKFLIAALMLISSSIAFSCPNFTGAYRDNEGNVTQYVQTGCESLNVIGSNQPTVSVITDGVMREVLNQTFNENGIEVKVKISIQATFTSSELIVNSINHAVANGQDFDDNMFANISLLPNGDMKTVTTKSDGSVTTSIDSKVI